MTEFEKKNAKNPFISEKMKARTSTGRFFTAGNFSERAHPDEFDLDKVETEDLDESHKKGNPKVLELIAHIDDWEYKEFDDMVGEIEMCSIYAEDINEEPFDWTVEENAIRQARHQYEIKSYDKDFEIMPNILYPHFGEGDQVLVFAACSDTKRYGKLKDKSKSLLITKRPVDSINDSDNITINIKDLRRNLASSLYAYVDTTNEYMTLPMMIIYLILYGYFAPIFYDLAKCFSILILIKGILHFLSKLQNTSIPEFTSQPTISSTVHAGKLMLMNKFLKNSRSDKIEGDIEFLSTTSETTQLTHQSILDTATQYQRFKPIQYTFVDENSLKIPLYAPRVHIECTIEGVLPIKCLVDLGATSSAISRNNLRKVEKLLGRPLRRLNRKLAVKAFNSQAASALEVVIASVESGAFKITSVPLLVSDTCTTDGLLGMNVIQNCKMLLHVDGDKTVVAFKKKGCDFKIPSISLTYKDMILSKDVTVMAQTIVNTKIPCNRPKEIPEGTWPAIKSKGLTMIPNGYDNKSKTLDISIANMSSMPVTLEEGTFLEEFIEDDAINWESHLDSQVFELKERLKSFDMFQKLDVKCICNLRTERSGTLLYFGDKFNFNSTKIQIVGGGKPLEFFQNLHPYQNGSKHTLYIKRSKDNTYPFIWSMLSKLIKSQVRVIFSFREKNKVDDNIKLFLDKLRSKGVTIKLYFLTASCWMCTSICNINVPELFRDCQKTKIFIMDNGTQAEEYQRLKSTTSPVIEMELGDYCHQMVYRSQDSLVIYVHVTNWHAGNQNFRHQNIIGNLFCHLKILGAPREAIDIYTSSDAHSGEGARQIIQAIRLVDDWQTSKIFDITVINNKENIAPFLMRRCSCVSCQRLREAKVCYATKCNCVFTGNLTKINKSTRVWEAPKVKKVFKPKISEAEKLPPKRYTILQRPKQTTPELANKANVAELKANHTASTLDSQLAPSSNIEALDGDEETLTKEMFDDEGLWSPFEVMQVESKDNLEDDKYPVDHQEPKKFSTSTHKYDQEDFFGVEDFEKTLNEYPAEIEPKTIKDGFFSEKSPILDWRLTLKDEDLPSDPELKREVERILDKYNKPGSCVFSHTKDAWRYLKVEPQDIQFKSNHAVVAKPIRLNPIRERILDSKIDQLINADLVEEVEIKPGYNYSISNCYVVPHSREAKILEEQGKYDPNQINQIDTSLFRLIVDCRLVNQEVCPSQNLNFYMSSVQEVLTHMSQFSSFSVLDMKAAYRSVPVTPATKRRYCFRACTNRWRHKILTFKSLSDGASAGPALYTRLIMRALAPVSDRVINWLDDVILCAKSDKENLELLDQVLGIMLKINALIKLDHLCLIKKKFSFLGYEFHVENGIPTKHIPDYRKEAFARLGEPTSKQTLMMVLGTANYMSDHIPGFALVAGPLMDQLRQKTKEKSQIFQLTEFQKQKYKELIKMLDDLPALHLLRFDRTLYIQSDSNFYGCGSMAWQMTDEGQLQVIQYFSKRFGPIHICQRSSIFKECSALMMAIHHFLPMIRAVTRTVLVVDLSVLLSLLSANFQNQDIVLSRMSYRLFSFGFCFKLKHSVGRDIIVSDTLSRVHNLPMTRTGVPFEEKMESKEFLEEYAKKMPKEWLEGRIFYYEELVKHVTREILKDEKINDTLKQKRLKGLIQNVTENHYPHIVKCLDEVKGKPDHSQKVRVMKNDDINVKITEPIAEEVMIMVEEINANEPKLTPPSTIRALNIDYIIRLQKESKQTRRVIQHLLLCPKDKVDPKIKKNFRLLDSMLLITRKHNKYPWSGDNIRIFLGQALALYVLGYMHLVYGHIGQAHLLHLFTNSFKCSFSSKLARAVIKGCFACSMYDADAGPPKCVPGRLARAPAPGVQAYVDIVKLDPGMVDKRPFSDLLAILDSYSNYISVIPIRDHTIPTIMRAFKTHMYTFPAPQRIHMDNEKSLSSPRLIELLKSLGVNEVTYSSANHSTSNSRIEGMFRIIRRLLYCNCKTFRRESHFDVLFVTIAQINSRPSLWLAKKYGFRTPPSAQELYFNRPPRNDILDTFISHLSPEEHDAYKKKYSEILADYEDDLQKKYSEETKKVKLTRNPVAVGDVVCLRNTNSIHKIGRGNANYQADIFEIIEIKHGQQCIVAPLFHKSRKCPAVHISHVRHFPSEELIQLFPLELQKLYGSYIPKEKIKNMKSPPDITKPIIPSRNIPHLRKRLQPRDDVSEPGVKGPLYSDSDLSDDDDLLFPKPYPPHLQINYTGEHGLEEPEDPLLIPQFPFQDGLDDPAEVAPAPPQQQQVEQPPPPRNDHQVPEQQIQRPKQQDPMQPPAAPEDLDTTITGLMKKNNLEWKKPPDAKPASPKKVTINNKYFSRTFVPDEPEPSMMKRIVNYVTGQKPQQQAPSYAEMAKRAALNPGRPILTSSPKGQIPGSPNASNIASPIIGQAPPNVNNTTLSPSAGQTTQTTPRRNVSANQTTLFNRSNSSPVPYTGTIPKYSPNVSTSPNTTVIHVPQQTHSPDRTRLFPRSPDFTDVRPSTQRQLNKPQPQQSTRKLRSQGKVEDLPNVMPKPIEHKTKRKPVTKRK